MAVAPAGTAVATTPIGSQTRVSIQGPDGDATFAARQAAVAHNPRADQFLIVWEGDLVAGETEIFGRIYSSDGSPVGPQFRISDMGATDGDTAFSANRPDVVYNHRSDEYLVVWDGDDDTAPLVDGELEIFGQRLTAAGAPVGSNDFRISDMGTDGDGNFDGVNAAIGYNSAQNEYLVVWSGDDNSAPLVDGENEIFGQRIDAAGTPIGANDARLSDMGPDGDALFDAQRPRVAYNDQLGEYMVVWHGDDNTAPLVDGENEIFGQRLSGVAAEIGANDVRLSDMGPNGSLAFEALVPDIAYNGRTNEYLVVWEGDDDTAPLVDDEVEIFGQRLSGIGAEIGANDIRLSDMGPNGNIGFSATGPAAAAGFRTGEYLVTWVGDEEAAPFVNNEFEIFGQRLDGAAAETGANDFRISQMGPDADTMYGAFAPAVAYGGARNEYMIAWEGDDNTAPLVDQEFEIYARRSGAAAVTAPPGPACKTITPTRAPTGNPAGVTLSRNQLLINQRISQAAVNRANALEAWLAAGIVQRDLCGGALTRTDMGPGVTLGFMPDSSAPGVADPRAVVPKPIGGGNASGVALSRSQLLINQRISQAAVRRANALKARLDGGLTGGDVADGGLNRDALQFGLGLLVATPTATPPAKTVTTLAPKKPGNPASIALSRDQLLINQRISQAAVKRTNTLRDRLQTGLTATDIKDASITAIDFAPAVRP